MAVLKKIAACVNSASEGVAAIVGGIAVGGCRYCTLERKRNIYIPVRISDTSYQKILPGTCMYEEQS